MILSECVQKGDFERAVTLGREMKKEGKLNTLQDMKLYGLSLDQLALKSHRSARTLRYEAELVFKRMLYHEGGRKDAYLGLGLLDLHRHNLKSALKFFRKAAKIAPRDPSVQVSLGNVKRAMKIYPGAIAHYRKALRYKNSKLAAIVNIALTYEEAASFKDALRWAKRGLKEMKKTRASWTKPFRGKLRNILIKSY